MVAVLPCLERAEWLEVSDRPFACSCPLLPLPCPCCCPMPGLHRICTLDMPKPPTG